MTVQEVDRLGRSLLDGLIVLTDQFRRRSSRDAVCGSGIQLSVMQFLVRAEQRGAMAAGTGMPGL